MNISHPHAIIDLAVPLAFLNLDACARNYITAFSTDYFDVGHDTVLRHMR